MKKHRNCFKTELLPQIIILYFMSQLKIYTKRKIASKKQSRT